jgi:ATP-dependent DNA ligase
MDTGSSSIIIRRRYRPLLADGRRCAPSLHPDGPDARPRAVPPRLYEEKVDGWRMLADKAGDHVRLVSRNGRDLTRRFRDLAAAIGKLSARTLVLDGG